MANRVIPTPIPHDLSTVVRYLQAFLSPLEMARLAGMIIETVGANPEHSNAFWSQLGEDANWRLWEEATEDWPDFPGQKPTK